MLVFRRSSKHIVYNIIGSILAVWKHIGCYIFPSSGRSMLTHSHDWSMQHCFQLSISTPAAACVNANMFCMYCVCSINIDGMGTQSSKQKLTRSLLRHDKYNRCYIRK